MSKTLMWLKEKKEFIESLNSSFINNKHYTAVESIDYEVYEDGSYYKEYLIIHYNGGAITARNCTGNSAAAVFQEIARYLNSGYYDEILTYNTYKSNNIRIL